jgi:ABC-2 type transport system permease protein
MSILALIIKREFIAKVRNKSFIVMTFLSPLLFVGIGVFVSYLSSLKADLKQIAVHDETGIFVSEFKNSEEYKYINLSTTDLNNIKDSIKTESYEGLIYIPKTSDFKSLENKIQYISNESPSINFVDHVQDVISNKITNENFKLAKLDTLAISNAQADVNLELKKATGEDSLKGINEIKIVIGGACGYLIMMFTYYRFIS